MASRAPSSSSSSSSSSSKPASHAPVTSSSSSSSKPASHAPVTTFFKGTRALAANEPESGGRRVAVAADTKLGTRKSQEDRLVVCEDFHGSTVLAVFDGTVGDFAAHFCQTHFLGHLAASSSFCRLAAGLHNRPGMDVPDPLYGLAGAALKEALAATDASLIRECARIGNDYTSSTAVVAMITRSLVTVAHLGDSRVAVGTGSAHDCFVTRDHKPDTPAERRRIESCGGSVQYLHQGKPFIRGGDFSQRQAWGDRPMQLNYSRAMGGKDLKMFGLSNVADVWQRFVESEYVIVLGSDGLWDTISAGQALQGAIQARQRGRNPAEVCVEMGLRGLAERGSSDNVTVVVCFLDGKVSPSCSAWGSGPPTPPAGPSVDKAINAS